MRFKILTLCFSFLLPAAAAFGQADRAFNFRCTSGFVTEGAGETFVPLTDTYSAAAGYGWLSPPPAACQDRSSGIDRRLAGFHVNAQTAPSVFQFDVQAGEYEIALAIGDAIGNRPGQKVVLEDAAGNTLISMSVSTLAGEFADAQGVVYSAAQWPVMAAPKRVTVAQGPLTLTIGTNAEPRTRLAHFGVKRVTATNQAPSCTIAPPIPVIAPGSIVLSGSGTDTDGPGPLTYQWMLPSTLPASGVVVDQPTITIPNSAEGLHQIELRCSDGALTSSAIVTVKVLPVPLLGIPMIEHTVPTNGAERMQIWIQGAPEYFIEFRKPPGASTLARFQRFEWRQDAPIPSGNHIFEIHRFMPGNPNAIVQELVITKP